MKTMRASIIFGLLMLLLPASGLAQSGAGTSATTSANHATKGVVTFVDANTLVITRSHGYGKEMSFELTPTTESVGTVVVGSTVDVRYRYKAARKIATAVTVEQPRPHVREREESRSPGL